MNAPRDSRKAMWQLASPDDPYGVAAPASGEPTDTELLDYAAKHYWSADLDSPSGIVLAIVLPRGSRVTGDLRKDLAAALGSRPAPQTE